MEQAIVEYWYNKDIEKYQLKAYIESEDSTIGMAVVDVEDGIEKLTSFYPNVQFIRGDNNV